MSPQVEVVAVGARTPLGYTAESSAAAMRAGIARFAEYPFADARGEPVVVAADGLLDSKIEGRVRMMALLESALEEVEEKLGPGVARSGGVRLLLSLPEGRPGFSEEDAAWVVAAVEARTRARGHHPLVELVGRGQAGGIRAVEHVLRECAKGREAVFLVAGVESYHHPETFIWLERERRFAQPGIRGGFIPGEGAGCLALVSVGLRRRLKLPGLAVVSGACTVQESLLRDSDTGSFGQAMTKAVEGAFAGLATTREKVDDLYIDLNGERYRSEEWGFVALRTPSIWRTTTYRSLCDGWGDVGAAAGVLGGVLAVRAFARGYMKGPLAMVLTGSDSGLRGAMLLRSPGPIEGRVS
ncbi:hypothetical protein HUA76_04365 [Myxococcus sp. CA056]|uniref:hypothetical protein n=1 Tax=Myxococcus sp. CA056 TaxID=2741740 RepID=UPI00157A3A40|nr:hypothetical protein [Myxococcus sp. CA056]NTX10015.1 hypothetical protein [Myxococcus sp. CA056]